VLKPRKRREGGDIGSLLRGFRAGSPPVRICAERSQRRKGIKVIEEEVASLREKNLNKERKKDKRIGFIHK